jgi:hypothetical protein
MNMLGVPKYITNTHTGRGYRSDRFSKPVRPVLSRNLPKTLPRENLPQEPLLLGTRIVIVQQGLPCSRQLTGPNRSDRFGKPVRPVLVWTVGKNSTCGKNSTLPPIDSFHGSK